MELWEELEQNIASLDKCLKTLRENGSKLAEAEYAYKVELSKRVFELKEILPATTISLVIYGDEKVADLRRKRDLADVVYKANMEAINIIKLKIKVLQNQVEREYANS